MAVDEFSSARELLGVQQCAAWLRGLEESRNLIVPLAPGDAAAFPEAVLLQHFVDGLRAEMLDFREIVEAAAEIAALNADQLARIVANTAEQSAIVEETAAAIAEIDQGAAHVASATESLRALTAKLAGSASEYDGGIDAVLQSLAQLLTMIDEAATFAASMESGSTEIRAFLEQLRRIARQARLLAINAAIEAAHLGDAGQRFVIVANEVRQLAGSTAESATEVANIEKQLRDASHHVEVAIAASAGAVRGLANDLRGARERSAQTRAQVDELGRAIGDVASIAGEQSTSLSAISNSVDHISRHAQEVVDAAQRASRLAIGDALDRLQRTIAAYTLGQRPPSVPHAELPFETLPGPIREAAAALRARVDDDQHEILSLVSTISVSIARNSYEWRAIAGALSSLFDELRAARTAIEETATGAAVAARASERMRSSLDAMRAGFAASVNELQRALERVVQVRDDVRSAESFVDATSTASERAAAILDLIDTISSATTLLALNAAIEAAHAGAAGSGFGIIADEIRSLAATTSKATSEIALLIDGVSAAGRSMSETTRNAVDETATIATSTTQMQTSIAGLRTDVDHTLDRAAEVATIVEQQLTALSEVRRATEIAVQRVESDSVAATDGRRIELAMLGMRTHAFAARRPLGTVAERIRDIGFTVAREMDRVFDAAVKSRALTLEDCFDTNYVEITGPSIARLRRLFDVSRVPPQGFHPPKFETRYDAAVEDGIDRLIDEYVPKHASIKAMFAVDLNGYCFGHFRECRQAWTGDYATDLNANRIKRFFEDDLSLRCSRVGLGDASLSLPKRTPYSRFRDLGCNLRATADRPWAIFTYARDTGVVHNDLSVALFADTHRVGTIRIIYDADVV